jgi:hypothetical protein
MAFAFNSAPWLQDLPFRKTPVMQRLAKSRIVVPEMPATFVPRLDILPESQRRLWPELDLAGMKKQVIQVRGSWKDYVDIHTLVSHGIDVPVALAAAKAIDRTFDPSTSIRAMQFYGDGPLNRVPATMQMDLTRWAQAVDLTRIPVLHPKQGLSPGGLER